MHSSQGCRVGQDYIYGVYTVFLQGFNQVYGHIRCTVGQSPQVCAAGQRICLP